MSSAAASSVNTKSVNTTPAMQIARTRRPVSFEVEGCRLYGMLDVPVEGYGPGGVGVLMLNSDDGCRLGPHNLWVRLADRLVSGGYPCLRFDYRGCGESEGPEESPPGNRGLTDAIAAERVLRQETDVVAVVLVGICYGAEVALLAGQCVPDVCGVVACSTGQYVKNAGYSQALGHATHYTRSYLKKLAQPATWLKLATGRFSPGTIWQGLADRLNWSRWKSDRNGAMVAQRMARGGNGKVPQLFIYGSADPLTRKCMPFYEAEAQQRRLDRRFQVIAGADHNFSSVEWSEQVIESVVEFVSEIGRE